MSAVAIKSSKRLLAPGSRLLSMTAAASTKLAAEMRRTPAPSIAIAQVCASGSSRRIAIIAEVSRITGAILVRHKGDRHDLPLEAVLSTGWRSLSRSLGAGQTAEYFFGDVPGSSARESLP